MANWREKPDFVVDSTGHVQDARRFRSGGSQPPPPWPPGDGQGGDPEHRSSHEPKPLIYLIPIPIGLIIYLLLSIVQGAGQTQKSIVFHSEGAYRSYNAGNSAFFSGEYDEAIAHFDTAIAMEPDMGIVYNARGLAYQARGDIDLALADFETALALVPNPAMVYNNRGFTYHSVGNYDQALTDLDRAIELRPDLGKAYFNRGLVYFSMGDYDRAVADLTQAVENSSVPLLVPTRVSGRENLFLSRMEDQFLATQSQADRPSVYYHRALAYLAKEKYALATADSEKVLEISDDPALEAMANEALRLAKLGSMGYALPGATATPRISLPPATVTSAPAEPVALYVASPDETPTSPIWENASVSCDGKLIHEWDTPGHYLYQATTSSGQTYYVTVTEPQQATGDDPCRAPWPHFGARLTKPPEAGLYALDSYRFCSHDSSRPEGTVTLTVAGFEQIRSGVGKHEAVRIEAVQQYSFPGTMNYPHGAFETTEWYVCGYGLVRSTTRHQGWYQGREVDKTYGLTLMSFTPEGTNESHVRHILADIELGDLAEVYRARVVNEETAEALRRWDAGIRVASIVNLERTVVDGHWRIVHSGTGKLVSGGDILLTTDVTE